MDNNRITLLTKIAELYYMQGLTQSQISAKIHIHRTEISKLLKEARKLGIVQITINPNIKNSSNLQKFFIKNFNLKNMIIVPDTTESIDLKALGEFAGPYISNIITSNSTIGISWGRTLAHAISNFTKNNKKHNITVVPLIGGPTGRLKNDYQSNRLVYLLSEKLNANSETLNTPAIVSSNTLKEELLSNPNNQIVFNYWDKLDYAIVGIGSNLITELEQWKEFYKNSNFSDIFKNTAVVGDLLSHPFTQNGDFIDISKLNIISIDMQKLKEVPNVIGLACGKNKVNAILGALNTGILDILITTDTTALAIKKIYDKKSQM
ncbi:DNA-binding transcriptional regulator LsrR (DeoR family) [Lactobacillus colini]|uniref:DNA-binding transcriptional regulator LsrR (DeoR family) n=1 Tax=Lactobacillus colini TaxID=1819254 RepID=A0ABS4MET5_9LACO|nr:sugar-binding transcriptional regulator [Lactobacillus colini]MBP2058200.1 DNA-binding transcriptional regulator LsrR (DeoR family) [Lactobacillus colini]